MVISLPFNILVLIQLLCYTYFKILLKWQPQSHQKSSEFSLSLSLPTHRLGEHTCSAHGIWWWSDSASLATLTGWYCGNWSLLHGRRHLTCGHCGRSPRALGHTQSVVTLLFSEQATEMQVRFQTSHCLRWGLCWDNILYQDSPKARLSG